ILLELAIAKICRPEEEEDYDAILDRLETLEQKLYNIDMGVVAETRTTVSAADNTVKKESLGDTAVAAKLSEDKKRDRELEKKAEATQSVSKAESQKMVDIPEVEKLDNDVP